MNKERSFKNLRPDEIEFVEKRLLEAKPYFDKMIEGFKDKETAKQMRASVKGNFSSLYKKMLIPAFLIEFIGDLNIFRFNLWFNSLFTALFLAFGIKLFILYKAKQKDKAADVKIESWTTAKYQKLSHIREELEKRDEALKDNSLKQVYDEKAEKEAILEFAKNNANYHKPKHRLWAKGLGVAS